MPGVDSGFAGGSLVDASGSGPYFIVAGNPDKPPLGGPISVSITSAEPPGTAAMETAANQANTQTGSTNPFNNFPGFDDPQRRSPYAIWLED